jgi:cell wall-associated NlpC family hydrolase
MDFSPLQNKEGVGAPAAQIARVQYSNAGEQALAQASGATADVLAKGFTTMKDQVEQTQALAANNMYNKLMSEGTFELMQKKEEGALNITEEYDKLQQKTRDAVFAKYKGVLRYGTGARAFNEFTERDNVTRRMNVMRYQQEQFEAYKDTQYKNALDVCNDTILEYGGNDAAIDMAFNRSDALIEGRWGGYGQEKVKEQQEVFRRQAVGQAMSLAMQTADFKRMDEICNKYGQYMDGNQRAAALGAVRKRAQQEMEFNEAQNAIKELGIEASRDAVKAWVQKNAHGNTQNTDGMYAFFKENIGKPYQLGGPEDGSGGTWDCGSFTKACGKTYGLNLLSRCADDQYVQLKEEGRAFSDPSELRTGDLVFWTGTGGEEGQYGIAHVGIYDGKTGKAMQSGNHGVAEIDLNTYKVVGFGRGVTETPLSDMEIEERTDKIFGGMQRQLAVRDREDDRLYNQTLKAILDLQNDGNFHTVAEYQAIATSIAGGNPRVLSKALNHALKMGRSDQDYVERQQEKEERQQLRAMQAQTLGEFSFYLYKEDFARKLQNGTMKENDVLEYLIQNPQLTEKQKKALLDDAEDYRNGKGLFAYDLNAVKGAVKNRFPGMNTGDFDASYAIAQNSVNQRIRDYRLKNDGQEPTQAQVITWATEDITAESYSSGGFFGGTSVELNRAQLYDRGIESLVKKPDGTYLVTLTNGRGAFTKKAEEVTKGLADGKNGYDIVFDK